MAPITEEARAKVNLTLKVRGRRADGYHYLESLIAFAAGVGDEVAFAPGRQVAIAVDGPFAGEITGKNLLESALERLAAAEPGLRLGRVTLTKYLPVAAGLGGGSADAAALLRAVRRANPDLLAAVDWAEIASAIGADVPVCLAGETALAWGVGEKLIALPALPRVPAVLLNPLAPAQADKTARVFGLLGARPASSPPQPPDPVSFGDLPSFVAYMRQEGNDLLAAASTTLPLIPAVRAALEREPGCLYAGLSGAGPTCFGVFASIEEASGAAARLRRERPQWWSAATVLGG